MSAEKLAMTRQAARNVPRSRLSKKTKNFKLDVVDENLEALLKKIEFVPLTADSVVISGPNKTMTFNSPKGDISKRNKVSSIDQMEPGSGAQEVPLQSCTQAVKASHERQFAQVLVCGSGECGQLGLGDEVFEAPKLKRLKALDNADIVNIFTGGMHTIALTSQGDLWSWGTNDQMALGRSGEETEPRPISSLEGIRIILVSCSDSASAFLNESGKLFICGCFRTNDGLLGATKSEKILNEPKALLEISNNAFLDIDAGSDHFILLDNQKRVWCFGNGLQYQLGRRIIERRRENSLSPIRLALKNIVKIGAGAYHSFAIDSRNRVYSWGLNNYGQCGIGTCDLQVLQTPTLVPALSNLKIKKIKGGEHFSVALTEDGNLYSWGRAESSQLGLDIPSLDKDVVYGDGKVVLLPQRISTLPPGEVSDFDVGPAHCLAITKSSKVYSWGFGDTNCLCHADEEDKRLPTQVNIAHFLNLTPKVVRTGAQVSR